MKTLKRTLPMILCSIGLCVLIFDSQNTLLAARGAVSDCLAVLIPSLFPFLFLAVYISNRLTGEKIRILHPLARICGLPSGSESLLLIAFLGGYPAGAQAVKNAWDQKILDTVSARRLLSFCSNAGPAFIFGVLGSVFSDFRMAFLLWLIQICSAILVARLYPSKSITQAKIRKAKEMNLTEMLKVSISAMATIVGWTILFRVLSAEILRFFGASIGVYGRIIFSGFMDLTNGCLSLASTPLSVFSFLCAAAMLSFGGLCVYMQTTSIVGQLGTRSYMVGKGLQTAISTFLTCIVIFFKNSFQYARSAVSLCAFLCLLVTISLSILLRRQKTVAFLEKS